MAPLNEALEVGPEGGAMGRVRPRDLRHVFPVYERPHTQVDHVPRRAVVVAHEVEGQGHVGVAVVQAQVVLQKIKHTKNVLSLFNKIIWNII